MRLVVELQEDSALEFGQTDPAAISPALTGSGLTRCTDDMLPARLVGHSACFGCSVQVTRSGNTDVEKRRACNPYKNTQMHYTGMDGALRTYHDWEIPYKLHPRDGCKKWSAFFFFFSHFYDFFFLRTTQMVHADWLGV